MSQNPSNPFPDGKLPQMPKLAIGELAAAYLSQAQMDTIIQIMWEKYPALLITKSCGEIRPDICDSESFQINEDDIGRVLRKEVLPSLNLNLPPIASVRIMWDLRLRLRAALKLPLTLDEVSSVQ